MGDIKDSMMELIEGINKVYSYIEEFELTTGTGEERNGASFIGLHNGRTTNTADTIVAVTQPIEEEGLKSSERTLRRKTSTLQKSFYSLYKIHSRLLL